MSGGASIARVDADRASTNRGEPRVPEAKKRKVSGLWPRCPERRFVQILVQRTDDGNIFQIPTAAEKLLVSPHELLWRTRERGYQHASCD